MEERSLRVYDQEKTFFAKITNTITKLLIPTQVGINGMLISIKRNNAMKTYEQFVNHANDEKKEDFAKKLEDMYALYLEALDKHILDSIYKKVKNDSATDFEKNALSQYYTIINIKQKEYVEYKYRKQKYLLELDFENMKETAKDKMLKRYKEFYLYKMEALYKGLLKHYSIKLADNLTYAAKEEIYNKIFNTLEEYINRVLPVKMELSEDATYKEVMEDYEKFEQFTIGKLDQNDTIEKRMVLMSISRKLFTHSLPLVVAEQCYIKLLKDLRSLIVDTRVAKKQEKAYSLLIQLIEEYNVKLLSTKVYWDKPSQREEYKKFWATYEANEKNKANKEEYIKQKEILFLNGDLKKVYTNENRYFKIIKFYKDKLVELGAMKKIANKCISEGKYTKRIKAA